MAYIGKSPTGTGVRSRYYYTATGGETSLSGADDNSNTLVFSDGNYVDVSLNGIALVAGTDYNTSTANTIGGLSALSASDIVEVVVYDIFTVADTVSAKDGGTFSGNVAMGGTLSVTGTSTLTGAITSTNGIYLGGTASANLLDNYYEGTWSPYYSDINGNAIFNESPTVNVGTYQRIGDFVTLHTYFGNPSSVTGTASYSASSQCYIGGLPFAVPSGNFYAGIISYQVGLDSSGINSYDSTNVSVPLSCITEGGYSVLRLHYALGTTMVGARQDIFLNSAALILSVTYKVT